MMTDQGLARSVVQGPQAAVRTPQRPLSARRLVTRLVTGVALLGVAGVFACESADDAQLGAPDVLAIGATEAPSYADANLTLYESQMPVPFPVRKPTAADVAQEKGNDPPYAHPPFLLDGDETIEVNFTLTNLDNESHAIFILIDPWNEYVRYKPGVTVVSDDETEPNLSGIEQGYILGANERLQGNITSLQMSTLALKLDTAMAIVGATIPATATFDAATLMNHDFDIQNTPGPNDPLLASYVPKVVAGLTGFDLGLQSSEPVNVAIELTVNVYDNGSGKILPLGSTGPFIGAPPAFLKVPGSR
jgi:hypothetical protein